ncbi:MAG: macro domain-containing protein [Verrucomicrobiota bacterium]
MPKNRTELKKQRDREVEINFLASVSRRLPENVQVLRPLAGMLNLQGRYAEGLQADLQLARLRPRDSEVWYNLGCSYALLQRATDAMDALQQAIDLGYTNIHQMFKDQDLKILWQNHKFLEMAGRASMNERLDVILGDICMCEADAVVNASTNSLPGIEGMNGAIYQAAGPKLQQACLKLKGCKTGEAKITFGYDLPAQYIIHTVGPIWKDGFHYEDELLAMCYQRCMELTEEHGLKTIAFPAISTRDLSYPQERATTIAIDTIVKNLLRSSSIEKVTFVCHDRALYDTYTRILSNKI